jgi:hypothetical protein
MKWKQCGHGHAYFKVLIWHMPGGTDKETKNLMQHSWSVGRDLNLEPPEYKARVLTTQL